MWVGRVITGAGADSAALSVAREEKAMFRMTIRELLLLITVIGLTTGWIVDHAVQSRIHSHRERELRKDIGWLESLLHVKGRDWKSELRKIQ